MREKFHCPVSQMRYHASVYLKSQRAVSLLLRRMRIQWILTDYCKDKRPMFSYPKEKSSDRTGTYLPPGTRHLTGNLPEYRNATENSVNEVPMLPGDYKILSPAVLQKSSRWTNRPSVRILTNWQHAVIWPIRASLSPQPSQRISAACVITASPRTVRTNANRLPPSFPASPT